jgi:hypothetical protein
LAREKKLVKNWFTIGMMYTFVERWKTGHSSFNLTLTSRYKEGMKIKEGEVPMKQVKSRPMTLARRREQELAMAENDDQPLMEGLYASHQVELYIPSPIADGVIPKNAYGNIDLFVDTMLPEGAVHLPCTRLCLVTNLRSWNG